MRKPPCDQNLPALSPVIRRGRKSLGPPTTPAAQLKAGSHAEGIEVQTRWEQVAGRVPARDQAGQRTNGIVSSILEPEPQSSSEIQREIQRLSLVTPVPQPHVRPFPDRRGSSCGENKDTSEDTPFNLGNTTSRYHRPAFSKGKAVTASQGPNNAKSEGVHKGVVGTPNQRVEEPCICTWCVRVEFYAFSRH